MHWKKAPGADHEHAGGIVSPGLSANASGSPRETGGSGQGEGGLDPG